MGIQGVLVLDVHNVLSLHMVIHEKSNVDLVVEYLFVGLPKPALVLGQEDCQGHVGQCRDKPFEANNSIFFGEFGQEVLVATYIFRFWEDYSYRVKHHSSR